jgi:hypothetical protein
MVKPIILKGYLEKSYLDKDGGKHLTFEYSAKDSLKIAKIELMGRDLENHLPVLLETSVKISLVKDYKNNARPKNSSQIIR